MNKIINLLSVFCCIAVIATSCEKEPILEVSQSSFTISDQGSSQTISFSTNKDWSASVSGGTWCTISPASGNSDVKSITVSVTANDTYDDRSATITIKAEELTKVITINQPKNKAILLTKDRYEVGPAGGSISVELRSNIDYDVTIPTENQGWITNTTTKGLITSNLIFAIAANSTYDSRQGKIIIKEKTSTLSDTVYVSQSQKDAIILTSKTFNVADTAITISAELKSNVSYLVTIPTAAQLWITQVQTKALITEQLQFNIARNTAFQPRSAEIIIRQSLLTLADTLYINQAKAPNVPTITTYDAYNVTASSVSTGGNVTADGGAAVIARGICWSTNENPTIADSKTINGEGAGTFTTEITGLNPGTKYYVRSYATNRAGTSYGQQVTFTTSYLIVVGTSESIQHIEATGNFVFRLNSLSNKDVFFVFSNKNTITSIKLPKISGSVSSIQMAKVPIMAKQSEFVVSGKPSISDFNNNPWKYTTTGLTKSQYQKYLETKPENYIVGTTEALFDETDSARMSTVRKVITAHGKNLYVWVDDLCWGPTSTKKHYVTQDMVDNLAAKFLNSGTNDDIYEWVTNICGAPWGPHTYNNLIPSTDDIHIWLTDIDGDNSDNGGVVGYFWGRNNFLKTSQPSSNEKVMFVIDAVMFSSPSGGTWELSDYWPQQVISVLAHEFHHMIYFCQKTVLQGLNDANSAVNEMLAQCVEDLVSNKIYANGPRGVPYGTATAGLAGNTSGRLPLYNSSNDYTLLFWSSSSSETYINYSKTYALGAYLMRNYGGANLVKSMVQNGYTGVNCIVNAVNANGGVGITYENILKNFGAANLLSDHTTLTTGYIFNTGTWFTSTINGISYQLGSINLYNYRPNPYIYSTLPSSQNPDSNVYYLSGASLTGTKEWSITGLNSDIKLTVIIK